MTQQESLTGQIGGWVAAATSVFISLGYATYAFMIPYLTAYYSIFLVDFASTGVSPSSVITNGSLGAALGSWTASFAVGYFCYPLRLFAKEPKARRARAYLILSIPFMLFFQLTGAIQPMRSIAWGLSCVWLGCVGAAIGGCLSAWSRQQKLALLLASVVVASLIAQPVGQGQGISDAVRLREARDDMIVSPSFFARLSGLPQQFPAQKVLNSPQAPELTGHFVRVIAKNEGTVILFDVTLCTTVAAPDEGMALINFIDPEEKACTPLKNGAPKAGGGE